MSYFVTGTDTGVGKTYLSCLLLAALRGEGIDAVGYKPVCSGDRGDAEMLAAASGGLDLDEVNPCFFRSALAPHTAAMLEGSVIDPEALIAGYERLRNRHQMVIVEGAGGWETPLTANFRISDLAERLAVPVIVVVANRLGALNHTFLTLAAIHARRLTCAGLVLNQLEDEMDTAMITNKSVLEDSAGVPLIDHLIHGQEFLSLDALLEGMHGSRSR